MAGVDLSLSGLASGFDWKTLVLQLADAERTPQTQLRKEQDTLNQRNIAYGSMTTELKVLQSSVTALKDPTLYDSRSSSVSDSAIASSSVVSGAASGSYTFDVTRLATASKRLGTPNVGKALTPGNPLTTAGFATAITAGTFTVNGKQIIISTSDTLDQVFSKIASATTTTDPLTGATSGTVTASYNATDDQINLSLAGAGEIVLGSATDNSNFLQVARLYNNGTGTVSSPVSLGGVLLTTSLSASNLATTVTNGASGTGEFKINGVSIKYDAAVDSVTGVLGRINNSAAGVTASYDTVNDRFQLTSKSTGDMDITMEAVSGNFLEAAGLSTSSLTHGLNLLYTINGGDPLISQSNTITGDSSGITGLAVNVVKEGKTTVTVSTDTAKVKSAITGFISQYNRVQSLIDANTASTTDAKGVVTAGILAADSEASDLASSLRRSAFSTITGLTGLFNHLSNLGIETSGDDNSLTLKDSDLLDSALADNLDSVKQLFSNTTNGIAVKLNDLLDRTVGEDGSLVSKQTTLTKQATEIDTQIADLEKIVQADSDSWTLKFIAMETAQQKMKDQLAFLTRQFPAS